MILGIVAIISCERKDIEPSKAELIVGNWDVKNYYHLYHDFTDENLSSDASFTLPDSNYIGYDAMEFKSDGTTRWHRNDLYVQQGLYDDPYETIHWQIIDDTLIFGSQWKYAIKELNNKNLVIEEYVNNGHEEYGHHHWEQIHRYTLKRAQ